MKPKTLVIVGLVVVFVAGIGAALLRELSREEATLSKSISGIVEVSPQLAATGQVDIVRTDRLVLVLVDPQTRQPVAMRFESPLVPPQTIRIGQSDARGDGELYGSYLMVGITDKDGEIFKITPGEVYGRSPEPVALGTEEYHLVLDEPFRGSLFNEAGGAPAMAGAPSPAQAGPRASAPAGGAPSAGAGAGPMMGMSGQDADPKFSIMGTISVSPELQKDVASSDRLIIMMFDPLQSRPAAFKIIPHTLLPQRFTITLPPEARGEVREGYSLRILTDKDDNPFGSAPGEVIGRSAQPVPLGTSDLNFVLDQPYKR